MKPQYARKERAESQAAAAPVDIVLQSKVYERMAAGAPALISKDDIISQVSQITDHKSYGAYHERL